MRGRLFMGFLCNPPVLLTFSQTPAGSLKEALEQLLEAVVSYTDPSGRIISDLFQKLPSKLVNSLHGSSNSLTLKSCSRKESIFLKRHMFKLFCFVPSLKMC